MANGIGTAIRINDQMSPALRSMNKALMTVLNSFEQMQTATSASVNTSAIAEARNDLARVDSVLNDIEGSANSARDAMGGMPDRISDAENKAKGLQGIMSRIKETAAGVVIGNLVTSGLSKAGQFLKESTLGAIEYASDLTEVQNVVDVAFGEMSSSIDQWATGTLHAVGLNELSAKQYAGTMGAMLKSSGIAGDAVAKMSTNITELAGDMASFYNLSGEEAFNKIRSGISGETEPLKQLGINMSVANLEAYAMSQGITTAYDKMSQAQQTLLRYNYLLSVTGDAQGDFARTQDSYANQTKLLSETWKDFIGQLASNALPILSTMVTNLNGFVSNLSGYIPTIVNFVSGIVDVLHQAADGFMNVYSVVADNWSAIAPIIYTVAGAIAFYAAVMGIANAIEAVSAGIKAVTAVAMGIMATATKIATAAQMGFNAALAACPLTWIIALILAVVIAIVALIGWILKTAGVTDSVLGGIIGALSVAVAFIANLFKGLVDLLMTVVNYIASPWIAFANFFANIFNDPVASIIHLFADMADAILGILEGIASAIDAVFGSNLSAAVSGWRGSLDAKVESLAAEKGNGSYEKVVNDLNLSTDSLGWDRMNYGDTFRAGAKFGDGIAEKVSDFSIDAVFDKFGITNGNVSGSQSATETLGGYNDIGVNFEDLAGNVGNIDKNTGAMKDSLEVSEEEIKYLHDIAERDAINKFTTAEVSVNLGGVTNNVSNGMDLDTIIEGLGTSLGEQVAVSTEGLHN